MFKVQKKTPKRVQPLGVESNYFVNILISYHKPKRGSLQWILRLGR